LGVLLIVVSWYDIWRKSSSNTGGKLRLGRTGEVEGYRDGWPCENTADGTGGAVIVSVGLPAPLPPSELLCIENVEFFRTCAPA
jgi:hypothetical protein